MAQPRAPDRTISVWIVEDSRDYRESLRELIEAEPDLLCPHLFGAAEELFAQLGSHFGPDVLLMDIGLPGMDGIEAVTRLRPIATGTSVVMLTVHDDSDRIFRALCAGASGYLSKSASGEDVLKSIREVVRGGAAMSPQVARRVLNMFAQLNTPRAEYGLTEREKDVLEELVTGKTKKRIARDLSLSVHTVDTHLRGIYAKLHVNSQSGAVAKALTERLVQ
jgi:DNA-binding NarL/FixJ family response regulator